MESDPAAAAATDGAPTPNLVLRLRNGEPAAGDALFERLGPSLVAWARVRVAARHRTAIDPAELAQEAWVRAVAALSDFDPARSFRYWLFAIAKHVLLEWSAKLDRRRALAPGAEDDAAGAASRAPDSITPVSRALARDETLRACVDRVLALPAEDRDLFVYCGLEDLTAAEAGKRLGVSTDAAMKRWQRLRAALREEAVFQALKDVV